MLVWCMGVSHRALAQALLDQKYGLRQLAAPYDPLFTQKSCVGIRA